MTDVSYDPVATGRDDTLGTDEAPMTPPSNSAKFDSSQMRLNVPQSAIVANIERSVRRGLKQLEPHQLNAFELAIVGGGWSLDETIRDLRAVVYRGAKIVALNNAAHWLMIHGLRPSMQIVMDARPGNARFLETPIPRCKYFIASQCDPEVFNVVAGREAYIFHVIGEHAEEERKVLDRHYGPGLWRPVPGAGTVGMVALILCRILGFRHFHLFGIDSCYADDGRHHAYEQPENDGEGSAPFWIAGREFRCSAWQAAQAENFKEMMAAPGNDLRIQVHGDGVLAHIVKAAAKLQKRKFARKVA